MNFLVEYSVEIDHKDEGLGPERLLERFLAAIGQSRPVPTSPSREAGCDASVTESANVITENGIHVIEYNLTVKTDEDLRTAGKETLKKELVHWIRRETSEVSFGRRPLEVTESWAVHTE